jgi:hypothetical protein
MGIEVKRRLAVAVWCAAAAGSATLPLGAEVRNARPSNYQDQLRKLKAGDTLMLAPGKYPGLVVSKLAGAAEAWITISGPESDPPAVIEGGDNRNTVEIENCSYVAIENLRIDSKGIEGAFGISAKGGANNRTHHIRIRGNTLVGQGNGQQTVGISTKIPTWGWVIRSNRILGAGTGIYLGDSDGSKPFVAGVIENNLVRDTVGYNMEIKDQNALPSMPGMPQEATSTIIRHNVFIKDDRPSPDGDRPNVLVGAFPNSGPGSANLYEIYGNVFVHNHQGSGRVVLHDNLFVDGPPDYPAVVLMKQNRPLKLALVYHNTVYTKGPGIRFDNAALEEDGVAGNLVFASEGIVGPVKRAWENLTAPFEAAAKYVRSPGFDISKADFFPLAGMCAGGEIDMAAFRGNAEYIRDFNGVPKTEAKRAVVFRGAYAGEGRNPGWQLEAGLKPSYSGQ